MLPYLNWLERVGGRILSKDGERPCIPLNAGVEESR